MLSNVTTSGGRIKEPLEYTIDNCIKWIREVRTEYDARGNAKDILTSYHKVMMRRMNFIQRLLFLLFP